MQAPKGPRGRGRGRAAIRAAASSKTNSDDETNKRAGRKVRFTGSSGSAPLGAAGPSHQPKTQAGQAGFRNKQLRNNQTPRNTHQSNGLSNGAPTTASTPLKNQAWRDPTIEGNVTYNKRMSELYQTLKRNREKERRDAIRDGFLADPNKPTRLANAITPVGTCQDMCPEFERVERIVQLTVDGCEKTSSGSANGKDVPCEDYMVKRFRRSAAGYDEQLPSDIRPPAVLQRTLNYLMDEVIGGPQPLANVHKFVWDRTRGIRNDFSIQQVTKSADLRIAIDCFERIARFHILSLHQLSRPEQDNGDFDQHQEREQLNNTLLSLMYYYDDSRHKIQSVNEAEFRAYCIIFEIQDMRPDLEDRSQNWPRHILQDRRIQTALSLYAAAGNTADYQGPLRPFTNNIIAQGNYGRFWSIVASDAVSYLMACAAEIYFNFVRRMALGSIWKAYKRGGTKQPEDWTLGELVVALGFDEEEQARSFCEEHGFSIGERADGQSFLQLASLSGKVLSDSVSRRKQVFSRTLVESKRLGRTLSAVINGMTASEAAACGMVEEYSSEESKSPGESGNGSLFITDSSSDEEKPTKSAETTTNIFTNPSQTQPKPSLFSSPFSLPAKANPFGAPTTLTPPTNPFNPLSTSSTSSTTPFEKGTNTSQSAFGTPSSSVTSFGTSSIFGTSSKPFQTTTTPKFNFLQPPSTNNSATGSTIIADTSPKSTFGFPPSSTGLSALPKAEHPAAPNSVGAKNEITTTLGMITSPSLTQTQTTNTMFNFNVPQQSQPHTPFPPNPTETPTPQQALSQTSQLPPTMTSDNDNLSNAPAPSIYQPSTEGNLPSVQSTISQSMQTTPASPFTALPTTNKTRSSSWPSTTSSTPTSTTPTASTQSTQPPQITKPTNKPASSLPRSTKPVESLRLFSQSSNTKPKISSPLAKPAITPPGPPENEEPSTTDARRKLLDEIAKDVMLGPNGLLEQFIEHTVSSIICDAYDQVQGEKWWEQAREVRGKILGRKYIRRWKDIAWRLGLLRKGRERRKTFGQSMRSLAVDSKRRQSMNVEREGFLGLSVFGRTDKAGGEERRMETKSMPPADKSHTSRKKRTSLDTKLRNSENHPGNECLLEQHLPKAKLTNGSTARPFKISKSQHKRSKTLGSISDTSQPRHGSRSWAESLLRSSHLTTESLLRSSTLAKARQLVPIGRLDTTQTDYFRLKALGIDPVTMAPSAMSSSPLQKKRVREDESDMVVKKAPRLTPPKTKSSSATDSSRRSVALDASRSPPGQTPTKSSKARINDEDEQLFAQMRSVREAMSESISWFQDERAKSELSKGSSGEEAREVDKGRTFISTPSRTEQRLARTGGHGLATKEVVVKRNSVREGKRPDHGHPRVKSEGKASAPQGFAALGGSADYSMFTGRVGARPALQAKGNSVEDAIEL